MVTISKLPNADPPNPKSRFRRNALAIFGCAIGVYIVTTPIGGDDEVSPPSLRGSGEYDAETQGQDMLSPSGLYEDQGMKPDANGWDQQRGGVDEPEQKWNQQFSPGSNSNGGGFDGGRIGNEFGSNGNEFGSNGNEFGSNGNEFGSKVNEFGSKVNEFGSKINEFGSKGNEFGSNSNEFGSKGNEFGDSGKEFGSNGNEYGNEFGNAGNKVVSTGNLLGNTGNEFGDTSNEFGNAGNKFDGIDNEFGNGGSKFGLPIEENTDTDNEFGDTSNEFGNTGNKFDGIANEFGNDGSKFGLPSKENTGVGFDNTGNQLGGSGDGLSNADNDPSGNVMDDDETANWPNPKTDAKPLLGSELTPNFDMDNEGVNDLSKEEELENVVKGAKEDVEAAESTIMSAKIPELEQSMEKVEANAKVYLDGVLKDKGISKEKIADVEREVDIRLEGSATAGFIKKANDIAMEKEDEIDEVVMEDRNVMPGVTAIGNDVKKMEEYFIEDMTKEIGEAEKKIEEGMPKLVHDIEKDVVKEELGIDLDGSADNSDTTASPGINDEENLPVFNENISRIADDDAFEDTKEVDEEKLNEAVADAKLDVEDAEEVIVAKKMPELFDAVKKEEQYVRQHMNKVGATEGVDNDTIDLLEKEVEKKLEDTITGKFLSEANAIKNEKDEEIDIVIMEDRNIMQGTKAIEKDVGKMESFFVQDMQKEIEQAANLIQSNISNVAHDIEKEVFIEKLGIDIDGDKQIIDADKDTPISNGVKAVDYSKDGDVHAEYDDVVGWEDKEGNDVKKQEGTFDNDAKGTKKESSDADSKYKKMVKEEWTEINQQADDDAAIELSSGVGKIDNENDYSSNASEDESLASTSTIRKGINTGITEKFKEGKGDQTREESSKKVKLKKVKGTKVDSVTKKLIKEAKEKLKAQKESEELKITSGRTKKEKGSIKDIEMKKTKTTTGLTEIEKESLKDIKKKLKAQKESEKLARISGLTEKGKESPKDDESKGKKTSQNETKTKRFTDPNDIVDNSIVEKGLVTSHKKEGNTPKKEILSPYIIEGKSGGDEKNSYALEVNHQKYMVKKDLHPEHDPKTVARKEEMVPSTPFEVKDNDDDD